MNGKCWINHKDETNEFNPARSYIHYLNNFLEQSITPTEKSKKKTRKRNETKSKSVIYQKKTRVEEKRKSSPSGIFRQIK